MTKAVLLSVEHFTSMDADSLMGKKIDSVKFLLEHEPESVLIYTLSGFAGLINNYPLSFTSINMDEYYLTFIDDKNKTL